MGKPSTFVKIDRNIINWQWYQNGNTFRVFAHCILSANIKDNPFQGVMIKRGSFATSYEKIANTLNLSVQQVRTAIRHLKSTGEITAKSYSKFQVITIVNYGMYQDKSTGKNAVNQHSINIQITANQQQLKNNKECIKNDKELCVDAHGKYENVFLTELEFEELKRMFPQDHIERIERLSKYMADTGRKYVSHYDTIIEWAKKDAQSAPKSTQDNNDTSNFDTDEFIEAAMKNAFGNKNI